MGNQPDQNDELNNPLDDLGLEEFDDDEPLEPTRAVEFGLTDTLGLESELEVEVDGVLEEDFDDAVEEEDANEGDHDDYDGVLAPIDDPVRQYLKEIGQVPLLNTNREIWLSIIIAADRLLEALRDRLSTKAPVENKPDHIPTTVEIGQETILFLVEAWERVGAMHPLRPNFHLPNLVHLVDELQKVFDNWDSNDESTIRQYLNAFEWGRDEEVGEIARGIFDAIHALICSRSIYNCASVATLNCITTNWLARKNFYKNYSTIPIVRSNSRICMSASNCLGKTLQSRSPAPICAWW
ncbi:MAG UNVERIFIED_CONTAM: hypothetical protein LVT10_25845 [Anaerolineae bacterium]|jgi:hypothetical protein